MKTVRHISKLGRILFGLVGIGALLCTSCAKEKDCDCTYTEDNETSTITVTIKQGKCKDLEISGEGIPDIKCE